MKINVYYIVRDHLATLYDARSNRPSYSDIIIFYFAPLAIAIIAFAFNFKLKVDCYNVSITFFGIFLALLLNIQVAIFAIYQRKRTILDDGRLAQKQSEELEDRQKLLGELNSNISYLTVVSSAALVFFILFFVFEWKSGIAPAISSAIYAHFILTFLMIIKRAHALFQKEYRDI